MGFIATKTIQAFLLPPANILILMVSGMILLRWHRSLGRTLIALGTLLLYLFSLPLAADLLIRPLESFAPPLAARSVKADAVVVLGSGVRDLTWIPAPAEPSETAVARLLAGYELAQRHGLPLVISGGSGEIAPTLVREADALADLAARLGFPRDRLRIDDRSRNTRENASAVRTLVPGNDIILVTSAYHMRRAAAFFAKQGFVVTPAPVAFRAVSRRSSRSNLLPRAAHLETSSLALSEYLSTVWYRMRNAI
jgi:uncharacterized SAM-binding protein YcdF (DUF218 family)